MDLTPDERNNPLNIFFDDAVMRCAGRVVASQRGEMVRADATTITEVAVTTIVEIESGTIHHANGSEEELTPGQYAVTNHGLFRQVDLFADQ